MAAAAPTRRLGKSGPLLKVPRHVAYKAHCSREHPLRWAPLNEISIRET